MIGRYCRLYFRRWDNYSTTYCKGRSRNDILFYALGGSNTSWLKPDLLQELENMTAHFNREICDNCAKMEDFVSSFFVLSPISTLIMSTAGADFQSSFLRTYFHTRRSRFQGHGSVTVAFSFGALLVPHERCSGMFPALVIVGWWGTAPVGGLVSGDEISRSSSEAVSHGIPPWIVLLFDLFWPLEQPDGVSWYVAMLWFYVNLSVIFDLFLIMYDNPLMVLYLRDILVSTSFGSFMI
jgi:hypothetical protein